MFDVKNRNVIVTGASRGFGYEFSRRLAMAGAKVCMTDIRVELGHESADKIRKMFGKDEKSVFFIKCDVSLAEDWTAMWDQAEKIFGGQVDILCNNAGVLPQSGWETCLNVMSFGITRGAFMALERMGTSKGGHGGRIINSASVAGLASGFFGSINNCGYEIAKWGNVALTRLFGLSTPDPYKEEGVKCYALCPWAADTELIIPIKDEMEKMDLGRLLTPQEVGESLMKALELDKNGAVYTIYPDIPMIEFTPMRNHVFGLHLLFGKVAARLGIQLMTPVHFYAMAIFFIWLIITIFNKILTWVVFGCE